MTDSARSTWPRIGCGCMVDFGSGVGAAEQEGRHAEEEAEGAVALDAER
jgi:hypothetical protein